MEPRKNVLEGVGSTAAGNVCPDVGPALRQGGRLQSGGELEVHGFWRAKKGKIQKGVYRGCAEHTSQPQPQP